MLRANMSEQEKKWDIAAAAQTLGSQPLDTYDPLLGLGSALAFEKSPVTPKPSIEFYPDRLAARFRNHLFALDLSNVHEVTADQVRIRLEGSIGQQRAVAFFDTQGAIMFNSSMNGDGGPKEPAPAGEPKAEAEQKQRVMFTGRIGVDPKVEETKNGKRLLKLPVAEKVENGTKWHTVLFFGEKADAMVERVAKGKMVTVVGYVHEQERIVKGPNGPIKKKVEVIFGSVIQDPNKSK